MPEDISPANLNDVLAQEENEKDILIAHKAARSKIIFSEPSQDESNLEDNESHATVLKEVVSEQAAPLADDKLDHSQPDEKGKGKTGNGSSDLIAEKNVS